MTKGLLGSQFHGVQSFVHDPVLGSWSHGVQSLVGGPAVFRLFARNTAEERREGASYIAATMEKKKKQGLRDMLPPKQLMELLG